MQVLMLNGKLISPTATLKDLGIIHDVDIVVHIDFQGGGPKRKRRPLVDSDEEDHVSPQKKAKKRFSDKQEEKEQDSDQEWTSGNEDGSEEEEDASEPEADVPIDCESKEEDMHDHSQRINEVPAKKKKKYAFSDKEIFDWLVSEDPNDRSNNERKKQKFRKGAQYYRLSTCRTKLLYVNGEEPREVPLDRDAVLRILKGEYCFSAPPV